MSQSIFSLLQSIVWNLREDLHGIVLSESEGTHTPRNPYAASQMVRHYIEDFACDPIATLSTMGCSPSIERKIKTLYRVREVGLGLLNHNAATFGYPIYICESN